jgi:hypothetical protein
MGNPLLRDAQAVIDDVDNGYVTPAGAMSLYGLEIDPKTLTAVPTPERRNREAGARSEIENL